MILGLCAAYISKHSGVAMGFYSIHLIASIAFGVYSLLETLMDMPFEYNEVVQWFSCVSLGILFLLIIGIGTRPITLASEGSSDLSSLSSPQAS